MEYEQLKEQHLRRGLPVGSPPDSIVSPHHTSEDSELIAEAKLLRQHKGRLEARMQILEDHNKQLESQLHRLRQLLEQVGGVESTPRHDPLRTTPLACAWPWKLLGHPFFKSSLPQWMQKCLFSHLTVEILLLH